MLEGRNSGMKHGHALVALGVVAALALPAIAIAHDGAPPGNQPGGAGNPVAGEHPGGDDRPGAGQKPPGGTPSCDKHRGRKGAQSARHGRCGKPPEGCALGLAGAPGSDQTGKTTRNGRDGQGEPGAQQPAKVGAKFAGVVSSTDATEGTFTVSVKHACPPAANTKFAGQDVDFKLVGRVVKPGKRPRNGGSVTQGGVELMAVGDRVLVKAHSQRQGDTVVQPFEADLIVDFGPPGSSAPASGRTHHF